MSLNVEAVVVSVGYSDFLGETLRENLVHLDNVVVVTSPDDGDTQKVCRQHSVHCVQSEDYLINGSTDIQPRKSGTTFNKGRLIRRGFDQIGGRDWVLHLDADIVLPRHFRRLLDLAHLDPRVIYGADRQDLTGWDAWRKLKSGGPWTNHAHENGHWFHPHLSMSSRWVSSIHGFAPIGYFQLFHGSALIQNGYHVRNYPVHHGDAARSDVQFALQWDRQFRQLIPEVIVLHLSSEPAPMGANWNGRTTKRFGPDEGHHHHHPPHPEPPCPPPRPPYC
jgi:hypothetical protein